MGERRRHPRYEVVTQVDLRLAYPRDWVAAFRGNTLDVSREGLAVALYEPEDKTKLIRSLLSEDQSVEVALEVPATGERISGKGMVKWLDIGPVAGSGRDIRAGILLHQMNDEDKARWGHFVQDTAQIARLEAPTV